MTFKKGRTPWNKDKKGLQIAWNKGKTGVYSEEALEGMKIAKLGKPLSEEHKKGISIANLGKHLESPTEEAREKMRLTHLKMWKDEGYKEHMSRVHLGNIPWNKGKARVYSDEILEKMRIAHLKNPTKYWLGKKRSKEDKEKMSKAAKGRRFTKETLRKILCKRPLTNLEVNFQAIVDKYNLPYKYVGNGSFIIDCYCPDFINTNNEKIAIEVYAGYFKKRSMSIEDWKIKRSEVFKQYGWEIVYFNENEVNEENVLSKLC